MLVFLWILGALGVAYGAKISGRSPGWWFFASIPLTPLVGGAALIAANRYGRRKR